MQKLGRPFTHAMMARFFSRAWTLEEAKAYYDGSRALLPENVQLLKLIELQRKVEDRAK